VLILENETQIATLLERIAIALEQIADSLAKTNQSKIQPDTIDAESRVSTEPVEAMSPNNDITRLRNFLASRGISIKTIHPEQESDETLDKIALFIGNRFESVKRVLDSIKANMNVGRPFSLNLRNESQQTVADTTNLCTNLYNIAFLTAYRYQKSPAYQLYATPSTSPRALNFYSGQWLERFVKAQVVSLLKSKSLEFSYICNAQISLPNGDDFELDMLFETEGDVFWLEAKTGDYRKHIEKYSKMSRIIGLDRSHTFMILADGAVTDGLARDLSNLFGMTVVRVEKFAEHLIKVLPLNCGEKEQGRELSP
jgi:hypothetical protein